MRKRIALVLVMSMVLSLMSLSAFAASAAGDNTITINNAEAGHTYTAYQILTGDYAIGVLSDVEWGTDITADGKTELYTKYGLTGENQIAAKVADAIVAADVTGAGTVADSQAIDFANTVAEFVTGGKTGSLDGSTYTISGLGDGYYLIVDTWTGAASAVEEEDYTISRYMVQLLNNVTINNKADKPIVDKDIVTGTDTTADRNTASLGDTITYKLTSKVPEYTGYTEYYMDFNDTLSKGLTFNTTGGTLSGVTVTIGGETLAADMFTVTVGNYHEENGTRMVIHFKDLVSRAESFPAGSEIVITYGATLNDDAVIGNAGNPNTANLTYSNDPLHSGDGTPDNDNPEEDIVTGTTPDSTVTTFVTEITLEKIDGVTLKDLAGAVFNIKGTTINKVLVKGQEYVEDNEGTYYKLKNGTYTTKAPTDETADQYESTTQKYKLQDYAETSVQETANVDFTVVTGDDGIVRITGLKQGTYTFTEIQAPPGYNLLDEAVSITITSNIDRISTDDAFKWDAAGHGTTANVNEDGTIVFFVQNQSGTELPSTGGIGTTIFYTVGALLVIGAGVILITRRRMDS